MHFTVEAQRLAAPYLFPGAITIDATAGNGWDTQFLAERVGPDGLVYAVDIQGAAIERVRARLDKVGILGRVELTVGDHANIEQYVAPKHREQISCAMFNLGYLPMSDKSVITRVETTMAGIQATAKMLRPGGLLSVLAYVGHSGGKDEANAVADWVERNSTRFDAIALQDSSNPDSPVLWSLTKREV